MTVLSQWEDEYSINFIFTEQGHTDPNQPASGEKLFKDEELVSLIDPILDMDDANRDGYIDYPEFIQAQQKAAATSARPEHA